MSISSEGLNRELSCRHKRTTFLSFGTSRFTLTFVFAPIDLFLLFYYTQVIGLPITYFAFAMFLFTIWDAINDPILAWLVDRNFFWTKKFGRRFLWIIIGAIPWGFTFLIIFGVPNLPDPGTNPMPTFLWLILGLFLFDLFGALSTINLELLRVDKFRTEEERRRLQGYNTPLSMIAQAMGMLIPPLFLGGGYFFMALMVAIITLISVLLFLPGCREDQETKDLYLADDAPRMNLFKGYWEVMKLKSFWIMFLGTVIYMTVNGLLTGMLIFIFTFEFDSPGSLILGLAVWLLAALISIPFWMWVSKKLKDTKKMYTYGMFIYGVAALLFFFYFNFTTLLIFAFIMGFAVGNMWAFGPNVYANVLDEYTMKIGKNQKGMVQGINAVFNRLAAAIDTYLITLVFVITGFAAYSSVETLADLQAVATANQIQGFITGFHVLVGIIPMILLIIGGLLFWKFFPLNRDRVVEIKDKLVELNI
jgi:GPH family glycoside/pentoside/hexuronide:cation symporter